MRAVLLAALAAMAGCATVTPSSPCDRDCQLNAARGVLSGAQLPGTARMTENGAPVAHNLSSLAGMTAVAIHGEYVNANDGQAIVVGTGKGADQKPAVFGLRLKTNGSAATEAELLVARSGEASLFPQATPIKRDPRFDAIVPESKRTSPEAMIAAANAYFDGIETDDGKAVPVTETCNRVENGVQTTHTPRFVESGCNSLEAFSYIPKVRDRRYPVVDVERGVVVAFAAFNIPGGDYKRIVNGQETTRHYDPRSLFLFEAFKIVDGKIEQIEATMRNVPLGASTGW